MAHLIRACLLSIFMVGAAAVSIVGYNALLIALDSTAHAEYDPQNVGQVADPELTQSLQEISAEIDQNLSTR